MSTNTKKKSCDTMQLSSLIAVISDELNSLSADLANVPFPAGAKLTIKDMEIYQNIDFCSQKIADFSSMLKLVSENRGVEANLDTNELKQAARLEFTHSLLKS